MEVDYLTDGAPNGFLRETGLSFHLADAIQQLDWKRKGYWNYYPEKLLLEMKERLLYTFRSRLLTVKNPFNLGETIHTTIIIGQMQEPIAATR